MYYACIFALLTLFSFCELFGIRTIRKKAFYGISFLLLMLTAGLRYETGGDWTSYTSIFESIEPIDEVLTGQATAIDTLPIEIGYKYLNSIVRFFYDNVQLLFFIVAACISILIFKTFPIYAPLPQLSVTVYFGILFFSLDMIAIRQGMAVAILFYTYRFIEERDWKKFLTAIVLASLFHLSALLVFPLYFLVYRRFSTRFLCFSFLIFLAVFFLRFNWLTELFQWSLNLISGPDLAHKITTYLTRDAYAAQRGITFGLLINIGIFIILILSRKTMDKYHYFNLFLNLFMCYLFVYFCMFELVELSNRLKYYFMISLAILLPIWVYSYKNKANRLISYAFVCWFSFMYCRAPLLELPISAAFNPYQNYIIYSLTGKKSTGYERLMKSDEEFRKAREQ